MLILLLAWLLIQLVGVIRAREPVTMVIALVGIVLWVLVILGAVQLPGYLRAL